MSLYLIQPCELIGTTTYKLGMSAKNDLSRVRSYHKGTRYLCIFECLNAKEVEDVLIIEFKKKYKLKAGNEYYTCNDENEMIELFINIFLKYRKINNKIEEKSYISEVVDSVMDDLSEKFSNITTSWMNKFKYNK